MYTKSEVAHILGGLSGDAGIVNAARVSFAKKAEDYTPEENEKLIRYLFKHNHWSPFGHPRIGVVIGGSFHMLMELMARLFIEGNLAGFGARIGEAVGGEYQIVINGSLWAWHQNLHLMPKPLHSSIRVRMRKEFPIAGSLLFKLADFTNHGGVHTLKNDAAPDTGYNARVIYESFRIKAPIFVARQAVKHQIGLCWNEVSRRYVDDTPEIYEMSEWRARPDGSIKQGSGNLLDAGDQSLVNHLYGGATKRAVEHYHALLATDTAPEQARAVLPLSSMTEWVWTGSLEAWHRVCRLRLDSHAQQEIREIAEPIAAVLRAKWPNAWQELTDREPDELG